MTVDVEFFYDLSSPWTHLAFHNIEQTLDGYDVTIRWRPLLVGGVFNAVNREAYATRSNPDHTRLMQSYTWLKEWAMLANVTMNFPSPHHPLKSVIAMRSCCALEEDQNALYRFSAAAFDAYFTHQQNLDNPAILAGIADNCGLDGNALLERAASQEVKDHLRANTQEAIDRGAFGSPTMFVEREHLYFGNDQLPLVRQRVASYQSKITHSA